MFYIPSPPNDEYSEGFRKLITRAIQRISRDSLEEQNKQKNNHMDCHQSVMKRRKDLALHNKRKSHFLKQCMEHQNGKQSCKQVILPKLQTPSERFKIRGEQLSKKFIISSDKQIKSLLYHLNREKTGDETLKNSISICVRPTKGESKRINRKIKSECSEQIAYMHARGEKRKKYKNISNLQNQTIGPWNLGMISINNFHDALGGDHPY